MKKISSRKFYGIEKTEFINLCPLCEAFLDISRRPKLKRICKKCATRYAPKIS